MSNRMEKVNSLIQQNVSKIIDEELRDRNLTGLITVTGVETYPDFSIAKIFVSMIGEEDRILNLKTLKKTSGYVRSRIAKECNFRKTPEIVFLFDESIEYGYKIDKILKTVTDEMKNSEEKEENK